MTWRFTWRCPASVAFPGETVIVGLRVRVPGPHRANWLILIVSAVAGAAGVSVPEAAEDTLAAPPRYGAAPAAGP